MKIIISHDIDHLKPSENFGTMVVPKAIVRASVEMLIGTISFKEYRLRIGNIIKNKWQHIDRLMEYDKSLGIDATYFIGVNNGLGLSYSLESATYWIKRILDNGFDVGVHGIDYDNFEAVKKEYDTFKRISGLDSFGIRMHYLRTDQKTYDYLAKAGYLFDATQYGLNKKHSKVAQMYEFPLHIMDGYEIETNRHWQTIKMEEAIQNTIAKIERAKRNNIQYLSILLHPKYFDESFYTWLHWYKAVVNYCKENAYEFTNYRDAIKEIRLIESADNKQDSLPQLKLRPKVCHISTVHSRYDVRIFHKECSSLAKVYEVHLIVADGKGDEIINEVHIHDIGVRQVSRINRVRIDAEKAFQMAKTLNCELYHFHDPELITIARKLQKIGAKVIYDVHEDLPRQIYGKPYMGDIFKPGASKIIEYFENKVAKHLDYIITATPFIRKRFVKINKNTIDINNFPILSENLKPIAFCEKDDALSYVGGIFENRGVYELIESLKISKVKLNLAGEFDVDDFYEKCKSSEGWKYVNYYGFLNRKEVVKLLNKSKVGIVSLYPLRNYLDSLPIKMFEYMLAGIPVIASDFPYWKRIVDEVQCGVNVNPKDPVAIAEKTKYLMLNPDLAQKMGDNGRRAVMEKYNWSIEEEKLLKVYKELL